MFDHILHYFSPIEEGSFSQVRALHPEVFSTYVLCPVVALSVRETFLPLTTTDGHLVHYQHDRYRQASETCIFIPFSFEGMYISNRIPGHNVTVNIQIGLNLLYHFVFFVVYCGFHFNFLASVYIQVTKGKRGGPTSHLALLPPIPPHT